MEYDDVGFFLAEYLLKNYPDLLKERFKLDVIPDTEDAFLHMAGVKRGAVASGGKVNLHKICELLIKEFRSGKLGRISLETPAMIAQEQIATGFATWLASHVTEKWMALASAGAMI